MIAVEYEIENLEQSKKYGLLRYYNMTNMQDQIGEQEYCKEIAANA